MIKAKRKRKSVREESLSPAVGSVSTLALEGYVPRGNLSGGAHLDFGILFVVFTLILIGCLMVYSASISLVGIVRGRYRMVHSNESLEQRGAIPVCARNHFADCGANSRCRSLH